METIGFQFINEYGYPLGNVQPTLEEAEHIARFSERGRFYRIKRNSFDGSLSMSYEHSKGMCKSS